jgi:hypothetical protein
MHYAGSAAHKSFSPSILKPERSRRLRPGGSTSIRSKDIDQLRVLLRGDLGGSVALE